MRDMRSEICKGCIHTKVCFKDKNICGDVFVPGNPMIFDNKELYRKYEERKAKGFPCNEYFPEIVRCKDCRRQTICYHSENYYCSEGERI